VSLTESRVYRPWAGEQHEKPVRIPITILTARHTEGKNKMRTKLAYSFMVLILLLSIQNGHSFEPNSTMKYLINEPASILDLGLLKLNLELEELSMKFDAESEEPTKVVGYSNDKIAFFLDYKTNDKNWRKNLKQQITKRIFWLRFYFGINPDTGKRFSKHPRSILEYFNHTGLKPSLNIKEIEHMVEIWVEVFITNPNLPVEQRVKEGTY
jgi:hypothetical protein